MRLSKDKKFLDETTINSLFSNIDSILLFNKNLYMSISDRLNGWEKEGDSTHQVIGDIFINAVSFSDLALLILVGACFACLL